MGSALLTLWRLRQNLFHNRNLENGDATQSTDDNVKPTIFEHCIQLRYLLTLVSGVIRSESVTNDTDEKFNADLRPESTALNPATKEEVQQSSPEKASNSQLFDETPGLADHRALAQRAVKRVSLDRFVQAQKYRRSYHAVLLSWNGCGNLRTLRGRQSRCGVEKEVPSNRWQHP